MHSVHLRGYPVRHFCRGLRINEIDQMVLQLILLTIYGARANLCILVSLSVARASL